MKDDNIILMGMFAILGLFLWTFVLPYFNQQTDMYNAWKIEHDDSLIMYDLQVDNADLAMQNERLETQYKECNTNRNNMWNNMNVFLMAMAFIWGILIMWVLMYNLSIRPKDDEIKILKEEITKKVKR